MKAVLPLLIALAGTLLANARLGGQQPPTYRGGVELIQLDVAVLDRNRRPVPNLTAADFTILEGDRERAIVAFKELTAPDPDGSLVPWMREVAPDVRTNNADGRRIFTIVIDDASIGDAVGSLYVVDNMKKIARAFVERMGPLDQASIVQTGDNSQAQEFTDDRAALLRVIDRVHQISIPRYLAQMYPPNTVMKVAESLIDVSHRRKALVYIGSGLRLSAGFTAIGASAGADDGASQAAQITRNAIDRAQRANVTIYTINPRGLEVDADLDAARTRTDIDDTLASVASETGGFAVTNTNSFSAQVGQIFRETGSYYLIGFQSAYTDGKYRRLSAKVNRPDVIVRARNGYAPPREEKPGKETPPLFKALAGVLPNPDVYMRAVVAPFAAAERPGGTDRKMGAVTITLGLSLPASRERASHVLELIATAFTREGKAVLNRRQTARLVLRPSSEPDAKFEILSRLDLKPGRYNLRFAVHNSALGKSGSVYADVEVPDYEKEKLSLSGVVLAAEPALPAAGADVLGGIAPIIPTTQRSFSTQNKVTVFLRAYQGGNKPPSRVTVRSTIRDDQDTVVFQSDTSLDPAAFAGARQADIQFALPLAALKPGAHLLTVEAAIDPKTIATRQIRLTVRD